MIVDNTAHTYISLPVSTRQKTDRLTQVQFNVPSLNTQSLVTSETLPTANTSASADDTKSNTIHQQCEQQHEDTVSPLMTSGLEIEKDLLL